MRTFFKFLQCQSRYRSQQPGAASKTQSVRSLPVVPSAMIKIADPDSSESTLSVEALWRSVRRERTGGGGVTAG